MHVHGTQNRALNDDQRVALAAAQRRVADRVLDQIDTSWLVPAPCRSRVLETALALRLMDLEGIDGEERHRLAGFLRSVRNTTEPDTLDARLARAALDRVPMSQRVAGTALDGFDHFTSERKRTMLHAVAVLFGASRGTGPTRYAQYGRGGTHPWASVLVTACEVIIAGGASAGQRDELLATQTTQTTQGIWEGHLLCHVLSLHALRFVPGSSAIVTGGISRMLLTARADGGVPFIDRLNIFCTAVAGLGLAATNSVSRSVVARLADRIAGLQGPQGGWG